MRYAEILLTYAESKIELNEIDASVLNAINLVRRRAGQPDAVTGTQAQMRPLIRRERTVELAKEGFRWFDIDRWDISSIVMPQKVMGIAKDPAVVAAKPNFKLNTVHLNNIRTYAESESVRMVREIRYWYPKLNLLPVPQSERDINPALTQNPEW
ncbi:RagB/SusD family nutrient uptake outer membrane protein [Dyadobacter sp. CY345]|nr:RagB/SusD family nutrient uptake outer membrane protein [Dyadobacter sp. CY345]